MRESLRELVTTFLDVLGLLLLAAGVTAAAARLTGYGPALTAGGVVVLAGSWWFAKPPRAPKARKDAAR